jgi:hypothetical protein
MDYLSFCKCDIDGLLNVILDIDGLSQTVNPFDEFDVTYGWTWSTFSF